MTIKELYEWAIEHKCENLDLYKKANNLWAMKITDKYCHINSVEAPNETIVVIE